MINPAPPERLAPDQSRKRRLAEGETHPYLVRLEAGEYIRIAAEQKGVDLLLRLFTPGGEQVVEVDSPTGTRGFERISEIAAATGDYRVDVVGGEGTPPGEYEIAVAEHRKAGEVTEADRKRVEGEQAFLKGEELRREKKLEEAIARYERALVLGREAGDLQGQAAALYSIGWMRERLDRWEEAARLCKESIELYRQAGDPTGQAQALNRSGRLLTGLNRSEEARPLLEESVRLFQAASDLEGEASALANLGNVHNLAGRFDEAVEAYEKAAAISRQLGNHWDQAIALHGKGRAYLGYGRWDEARSELEKALQISEEIGAPELSAGVLDSLGGVEYLEGHFDASRVQSERALKLYRELGKQRGEAMALSSLASVALKTGAPEKAQGLYEEALTLSRALGDAYGVAMLTSHLGRVALDRGEARRALELQKDALARFEKLEDRLGLSIAHYGIAQALVRLEDLDGARREIEASLGLAERQRAETRDFDLRAFYFATRQHYWELYLDILLGLDRRRPGEGFRALALEAEEKRRARSLLDALAKTRTKTPETLSSQKIQERLLDTDTLLLIYSLGEERSLLWKITRSTLTSHELPRREQIETAAGLAYDTLSKRLRHGSPLRRKAVDDLAQLILSPVAQDLPKYRRLLIVADGALYRIPFGALPDPAGDPGDDRRPLLVQGHQIIYLPSASVGATLRQERSSGPLHRRSGPLVAILADPVFDVSDPRVAGRGAAPAPEGDSTRGSLAHALRDVGMNRLERLPFSREEALAIQQLLPDSTDVLPVLDFAANQKVLEDERWRKAPILHFATHGLLDDRRPELSGLVFSLVNPDGSRRPDGFLRLREIYGLDLNADLVVLSACQTGRGKELRGEGLLGLTQGFMSRGVPQLVVSLWKVEDRATKELMQRFYRELFDGYKPAEALQRAQKTMLREEAWSDPALWAGFIFAGDFERRPGGGIDTRDTGGTDPIVRVGSAGLPPPKIKPKPPKPKPPKRQEAALALEEDEDPRRGPVTRGRCELREPEGALRPLRAIPDFRRTADCRGERDPDHSGAGGLPVQSTAGQRALAGGLARHGIPLPGPARIAGIRTGDRPVRAPLVP